MKDKIYFGVQVGLRNPHTIVQANMDRMEEFVVVNPGAVVADIVTMEDIANNIVAGMAGNNKVVVDNMDLVKD